MIIKKKYEWKKRNSGRGKQEERIRTRRIEKKDEKE